MLAPVWLLAQFPEFPDETILTQSFQEWYESQSNTTAAPDRKIISQVFLMHIRNSNVTIQYSQRQFVHNFCTEHNTGISFLNF